jgi:predicted NACHT family NTPase
MSQQSTLQQAQIDALYLENRELKRQLSGNIYVPFEIPSAEWSQRVSKELWVRNAALQKINDQLEAKLEAKCYP